MMKSDDKRTIFTFVRRAIILCKSQPPLKTFSVPLMSIGSQRCLTYCDFSFLSSKSGGNVAIIAPSRLHERLHFSAHCRGGKESAAFPLPFFLWTSRREEGLKELRRNKIHLILQDPVSSFRQNHLKHSLKQPKHGAALLTSQMRTLSQATPPETQKIPFQPTSSTCRAHPKSPANGARKRRRSKQPRSQSRRVESNPATKEGS